MRSSRILALLVTLQCSNQMDESELMRFDEGNSSRSQALSDFVELRKLQVLELFPVASKIPGYVELLNVCYQEAKLKSAELENQIIEDDQAFLDSIEAWSFEDAELPGRALDEADPVELAARTLVRRIWHLHESGDAYAPLMTVDGSSDDDSRRRSTDLWEQFSRSAVDSLLKHSPRYESSCSSDMFYAVGSERLH
jgi:hypothetical protein